MDKGKVDIPFTLLQITQPILPNKAMTCTDGTTNASGLVALRKLRVCMIYRM